MILTDTLTARKITFLVGVAVTVRLAAVHPGSDAICGVWIAFLAFGALTLVRANQIDANGRCGTHVVDTLAFVDICGKKRKKIVTSHDNGIKM